MTMSHMEPFQCPECGAKGDREVYDSINVTLNPELKQKVFDGAIWDCRCPKCNTVFRQH